MLGHVDESTLVRLYQSALALVYPSRYEGFGLPLVEAMACGAPVLAADASTSEELIGDAGQRLPEDDSEAWASAIAALMTSPERREDFRRRGLRRAQTFTWRRTAEATYAVYRECADR
jgi:glycosyltransferase involved in cell wall biosynthesis